jgi:hypothetical protein
VAEQAPRTEVYVVINSKGNVVNAGGQHSSPGSFWLSEYGARKNGPKKGATVLRGTITWEVVE